MLLISLKAELDGHGQVFLLALQASSQSRFL